LAKGASSPSPPFCTTYGLGNGLAHHLAPHLAFVLARYEGQDMGQKCPCPDLGTGHAD
jgi:hypothetical protein